MIGITSNTCCELVTKNVFPINSPIRQPFFTEVNSPIHIGILALRRKVCPSGKLYLLVLFCSRIFFKETLRSNPFPSLF